MIKSLLKAYRESWKMLKGKRKDFVLLLLPISLVKILSPLIIPFMLRMIFDAMEGGEGSRVILSVLRSSIAFSVLLVIVFCVNIYGDAWASRLSFYGIKNRYFTLFTMPVSQLIARYSKGEVFNRIQAGCNGSLKLWFQSIDILSNLAAIVGLFLMASLISPVVLGVIAVVALTDTLATIYLGKRNQQFAERIQREEGRRLEMLHTVVYDAEFLTMNNAESLATSLYQEAREKRFAEEYKQLCTTTWLTSLLDTIASGYHSFLSMFLFVQKRDSKLTLGGIGSASSIFTNLRARSAELAAISAGLPNTVVPIHRMEELFKQTGSRESGHATNEPLRVVISMENVSFVLGEKLLLSNLDLKVTSGEKVAVVGSNGSGKSTLIKLLAGLYQNQTGTLQVLGQDSSFYRHNHERGRWISYIPAESQLYVKQSVVDNVKMGGTTADDPNISQVLSSMLLDNASFMEGSTAKISGGEAQRVNISRAMLQRKPLLLADEPTSALDVELADQVMDYLLTHSETMIFVTHNPAHARKADRVLLMENGRIIADVSTSSAEWERFFKIG